MAEFLKQDVLSFFRPESMNEFVAGSDLYNSLSRVLTDPDDFRVYLLFGPSGLGKTSFARIFAKHFGVLNTTDYVEINCANTRGIDDAREILMILQSAPMYKHKVVVLDEAHQLTQQAQNALLKGLEDVRSTNFVFICSTSPEGLIDTIKTRSYKVNFKPEDFPAKFENLDDKLRISLLNIVNRMIDNYFPTKRNILNDELVHAIVIKYLTYNTNEAFSVRQYIAFWYSLLVNLEKDSTIDEETINRAIFSSVSKYSPILLARFLVNYEKHCFNENTWPKIAKKIINLETTIEAARILILNYIIKYMMREDADLEYGTHILKCFSRPMLGSDAKAMMFLAFRKIYDFCAVDNYE